MLEMKEQESFVRDAGFLSVSTQGAIEAYAKAVLLLQDKGITKQQLKSYREGSNVVTPETLSILRQAADLVVEGAVKDKVNLPAEPSKSIGDAAIRKLYPRTHIQIGSSSIETSTLILCPYVCIVVADSLAGKAPGESIRLCKAAMAMGVQLIAANDDICEAVGIFSKEEALKAIRAIAVSTQDTSLTKRCDAMISAVHREFEAARSRTNR